MQNAATWLAGERTWDHEQLNPLTIITRVSNCTRSSLEFQIVHDHPLEFQIVHEAQSTLCHVVAFCGDSEGSSIHPLKTGQQLTFAISAACSLSLSACRSPLGGKQRASRQYTSCVLAPIVPILSFAREHTSFPRKPEPQRTTLVAVRAGSTALLPPSLLTLAELHAMGCLRASSRRILPAAYSQSTFPYGSLDCG